MSDKPVIVATDGSDNSRRILPHAACLAANLGARIDLLRVVEKDEIAPEPGESDDVALARARQQIESDLEADLKHFDLSGGIQVIYKPDAVPADALLEAAQRGQILAMHSRGRGGLARIIHGSVAIEVLKGVGFPMMLGGPNLLPPRAGDDVYHLVATTDFSPDSEHCLRTIVPLLESGNFHVTLLHVHLHSPAGLDNEAERTKHAADLAAKRSLLPASTIVDSVIREIPIGGGIDTAIMEVAEQVGADAIAIATHGHSARHQLIMGSVAMSILSRSHLPLIVARAEGAS
jgi:nucleotide-binding universal stress UspA family protein